MSSKSENAEIAVLQTQMEEQTKLITETNTNVKDLSLKMDNFSQAFVPRAEYEAFKKSVRLNYFLAVLITAVMTGLIYNFLKVHGA